MAIVSEYSSTGFLINCPNKNTVYIVHRQELVIQFFDITLKERLTSNPLYARQKCNLISILIMQNEFLHDYQLAFHIQDRFSIEHVLMILLNVQKS
jgi:hypothetical protein